MYAYIRVYIYHICICIHVCVYIYIYTHVRVCVCMYIYIYICICNPPLKDLLFSCAGVPDAANPQLFLDWLFKEADSMVCLFSHIYLYTYIYIYVYTHIPIYRNVYMYVSPPCSQWAVALRLKLWSEWQLWHSYRVRRRTDPLLTVFLIFLSSLIIVSTVNVVIISITIFRYCTRRHHSNAK